MVTSPVHGTGCALASAITAELAKGAGIVDAVLRGREFLIRSMHSTVALGKGAEFLAYPK